MLPPLDHIACTVTWTDPITAAPMQHTMTLADLGLRPIDALYLLKPDNVQAMAEIDDRIQRHVAVHLDPQARRQSIEIQYMTAPAGQFSVFESGPLLRSLRSLLTQSRPLRASDVLRANDASQQDNATVFVDQSRLTAPLATLTTLAGDIDTFVNTTLAPLLLDTDSESRTDHRATWMRFWPTPWPAGACGAPALPSSGWGFLYAWLHQAFVDLLAANWRSGHALDTEADRLRQCPERL